MILEVKNVHTFYGLSHVLQGISLQVNEGEIVLLSGRNGAGKTTLLRTIVGLVPPRSGQVNFLKEKISGLPVHQIAQKGISLVPEERWIIPGLTVYENLKLALLKSKEKLAKNELRDRVKKLFPVLEERWGQEGTSLSGGEQQMLAIARGLISNPRLMLIDEPSEGLMPVLVEKIRDTLKEIQKTGVTILLVEQNIEMALEISSRCYLMDEGLIRFSGTPAEIHENDEIQRKYLAV